MKNATMHIRSKNEVQDKRERERERVRKIAESLPVGLCSCHQYNYIHISVHRLYHSAGLFF